MPETPPPSAWDQIDFTNPETLDVARLAVDPLYGNTPLDWLAAPLIAIAVFVALRLFFRFVGRLAERQKKGSWLAFGLATLTRTHWLPILLVSLRAGGMALNLPDFLESALRLGSGAGVLLQFGLWATGAVEAWAVPARARYLSRNPAAVTTMEIGRIALHGFIWAALLLMFLDHAGFDVTALVAGLGIGGIAVALAVQNLLGDLLASVSIAMDKPFVVGDFLIVGTEKGTVENIGIKTTRLRSLSGEQIVVSNADLLASRIQNYGRMYERRTGVTIGVTYDTPRAKLELIPGMIKAAIEARGAQARFDRAHFARYGDFSLDFEYVYYVTSPDYAIYMDVQQAINLDIHKAFEDSGISFAFPTQTLYVRREGAT